MSSESKKSLMKVNEEMRYSDEQEIVDRKDMVLPSPRDFKPENARRKIRLALTMEKTILRRGEAPRFRLEMTNVGREMILYMEFDQSFYKTCNLSAPGDHLNFTITLPDGHKKKMLAPTLLGDEMITDEIKFPAGWTDVQKAEWARKKNLHNHAQGGLSINLQPGETLRTRGDNPGDLFCAIRTEVNLRTPGTYKMQVKFDDVPPPVDEDDIRSMGKRGISRETLLRDHDKSLADALGPVESNGVSFEVVP